MKRYEKLTNSKTGKQFTVAVHYGPQASPPPAPSKSRVIFAITRHEEVARRRYPWAQELVELKNGFWCFEDKADALAYRLERTSGTVPGTGKAPAQE